MCRLSIEIHIVIQADRVIETPQLQDLNCDVKCRANSSELLPAMALDTPAASDAAVAQDSSHWSNGSSYRISA